MKVVDLCINARSGKNARPVSGDVTFDDGARYGWSQYDDATRFTDIAGWVMAGWSSSASSLLSVPPP
jgi:hypothetical protein